MILKQCYLTHNDCYWNPKYKVSIQGKPTGIVVHDTGAGNPYLKRYIQARDDNPNMATINADLGKNTNNNDWNKSQSKGESNRWACVHAFIGLNAKDQIEVYETLPYDLCCWGVGDGSKGSFNYNPTARIQFEICDDGYVNEEYFNKCFDTAAEYCAYLCKKFGFGVDKICNHHESYKMGYGGNHADTDTWMAKFGKNMDWFRAKVQKILDNDSGDDEPMTPAERTMVEELSKKVDKLTNSVNALAEQVKKNTPKVYHYYTELPKYCKNTITKMHKDKVFSGAGPGDMALTEDLMRTLFILARRDIFGPEYANIKEG